MFSLPKRAKQKQSAGLLSKLNWPEGRLVSRSPAERYGLPVALVGGAGYFSAAEAMNSAGTLS